MRQKIIRAVTGALAAVGLAGAALAGAAPASAVTSEWTGAYTSNCAGGHSFWNMQWLGSGVYVRPGGWSVTLITTRKVWITQVVLRSFDANNGNKQVGVYALNYGSPSSSTTGLPWTYGEVLQKTGIPNALTNGTAWVLETIFSQWGNLYMKLSDGTACSYSPILSAI